jgi:hypothetical protein
VIGWHWTWQDPVALGLAVVGIGLAFWLHRRLAEPHGCGKCPLRDSHGRRQ